MTMDGETPVGDVIQVRWGLAEKWIAAGVTVLLFGLGGWAAESLTSRMDKQAARQDEMSAAVQELATQAAVTNSQLTTLNLQLADIPALSRKIAEHDVRIERLESDVRDVRSTRSLQ